LWLGLKAVNVAWAVGLFFNAAARSAGTRSGFGAARFGTRATFTPSSSGDGFLDVIREYAFGREMGHGGQAAELAIAAAFFDLLPRIRSISRTRMPHAP
jgi:uncharacterized protein (DUF58 family)